MAVGHEEVQDEVLVHGNAVADGLELVEGESLVLPSGDVHMAAAGFGSLRHVEDSPHGLPESVDLDFPVCAVVEDG